MTMLPTPSANAEKQLFIRLLTNSRTDRVRSLLLKNSCADRVRSLRENIAALDNDDRNFSSLANQLITNGTADPKWIINWVYSSGKTHNAIREAKRKSSNYSIDYTSTNFILEDAMLLTALDRLGYGDDDTTTWFTQYGQGMLLEEAPELRPHLLASVDTVYRYYGALTTAIHIVHPRDEYPRFREQAPAFIAWVKHHDEPTLILEAAIRAQSLNRSTIEAFMPMVRSTPSVVQDGLL